jgi:AmiR/NasT family two-component response regulator
MVEVKEKTKRIQILITEGQKKFLDNLANSEGISLSALIREIVHQYQKDLEEQQLLNAAKSLLSEYKDDEELRAFTALDGEDFL